MLVYGECLDEVLCFLESNPRLFPIELDGTDLLPLPQEREDFVLERRIEGFSRRRRSGPLQASTAFLASASPAPVAARYRLIASILRPAAMRARSSSSKFVSSVGMDGFTVNYPRRRRWSRNGKCYLQ